MRVFSGDGPARQLESGQRREGNFSCLCGIAATDQSNIECALQSEVPIIEKRLGILQGQIIWSRFSLTNPSPCAGLLKDDIMRELESRGVSLLHKPKAELQQNLQDILRCIQCPPVILTTFNESAKSILNKYELPACEPLHDINVVCYIITELLSLDDNVQKEFKNLSGTTVGDKNQIKGSDARHYAVKLTQFCHNQLQLDGTLESKHFTVN
ncbi:hypothetical protein FSP39_008349 [Pinctada imbricata]|uniref:Uncharacterized protein n=1 Tax=Pinctada imbricata TaxID=66713 RepID=A0AA89C382_PINIB|nr:hypothetical protein FSP39_008349 [Pinctada imbricata]